MARPPANTTATVLLPHRIHGPLAAISRRVALALAIVCAVAAIVRLDNEGYHDNRGDGVSLLDAFYYATVSVTTTGYGDIVPVDNGARLLTSVVVTVARMLFVILLVGTTVEVATQQGRDAMSRQRWRKKLRDHVIVCGYGTKGRSAVKALLAQGTTPDDVVVIDSRKEVVAEAAAAGFAAVQGDATRSAVLEQAGARVASAVIVASDNDASAVLTTLTAREMNPSAIITSAVREGDNAHLLRQGGANSVIVSSEASGRLLGMSTHSPEVVKLLEDLLTAGSGMEIFQRDVTPHEVKKAPSSHGAEIVIAIIRDGVTLHVGDTGTETCQVGDRLIVLQPRISSVN